MASHVCARAPYLSTLNPDQQCDDDENEWWCWWMMMSVATWQLFFSVWHDGLSAAVGTCLFLRDERACAARLTVVTTARSVTRPTLTVTGQCGCSVLHCVRSDAFGYQRVIKRSCHLCDSHRLQNGHQSGVTKVKFEMTHHLTNRIFLHYQSFEIKLEIRLRLRAMHNSWNFCVLAQYKLRQQQQHHQPTAPIQPIRQRINGICHGIIMH